MSSVDLGVNVDANDESEWETCSDSGDEAAHGASMIPTVCIFLSLSPRIPHPFPANDHPFLQNLQVEGTPRLGCEEQVLKQLTNH